jgi:uncharacterized membrane protein/protein-disulfide isomerase
MKPIERGLSLVLVLIGLAASTASAYVHHRLIVDPTYSSFCDVSSTVSCTQAYTSAYGSFHGVPVAIFGIIFFVAMLLLVGAAQVGSEEVRESVPGYLFVSSTIGLSVVFYLGYAAFFILKAVCILCVTTYVSIIGLFILTGSATRFPMSTLPRRAVRDLRLWSGSPLAIAVTILFLAGAVSAIILFPRAARAAAAAAAAPTQAQLSELERFMATAPRVPIVIPREGAKVLVIKFHDYQCPPCRQSYEDYKPIFAKYEAEQAGAVRLVEKDFPISPECNRFVTPPGLHPASCEAAVAVRLAAEHNRRGEMEDWLFENQPKLTPQVVRDAAREIGHVPDYDERYQSILGLVKGDVEYAHQLGVRSTPTFFVNGVKLEGETAPRYFDQAIAFELRQPPR